MAVVLSPQRAKTDGGSDGYGRREAQGRDHRRLGKPDGLPPAGRRGRARDSGSCGPTIRDVAPDDLAERDPLDLYGAALAQLRSAEAAAAGRGQAAGLQPQARAARLAVDPYRGRDRQRRHAVPGRQRRHRAQPPRPEHPPGDPSGAWRCAATRPAGCVDLGTAEQVGDGLRESFMLLEIDRQTRPEVLTQLEADLRRVLGDVRHAVQDWQAMRGRIEAALEELRAGASVGAGRASGPRRRRSCAWIGAGNFTLLGCCSYQLEDSPNGAQLRRMKGNGARHSPRIRRRRPVAELQQPAARDPRARPRAAASAHRHQGQHSQHRASRYLPRLHRRQAVRAGRQRGRRAPLSRPADLDRLQHEPAADPAARPQGRAA